MGKKRIWSIVLIFCLLVTMFPGQNVRRAKAEGTYDEPEKVQIYLRMNETWSKTYPGYQGISSMSWFSNNGMVDMQHKIEQNQVSFVIMAKQYGSAEYQYGLIPVGDTEEKNVRWIQFNIRVVSDGFVIPTENPNPTPTPKPKEAGDTPDVSFGVQMSEPGEEKTVYVRNSYGHGIDIVKEDGQNGIELQQKTVGDYNKYIFTAGKTVTSAEKRVWLKRYQDKQHTQYELVCIHATFGDGYTHAQNELMKLRTPVELTGTLFVGEWKRFELPRKLSEAGYTLDKTFNTANMPGILAQQEERGDDYIVYQGLEEGQMTGVYSAMVEGVGSEPEPALITHMTVLPKGSSAATQTPYATEAPYATQTPSSTQAPSASASPNSSGTQKTYSLSPATVTLKAGKKKVLSIGKKLTKKQKKKVKWSSADSSVASVKNGKVTAKKAGVTSISAKYNKKTYKCTVYVDPKCTVAISHAAFTKAKQVITAKTDHETVLGNVKKDGYSITIPAGTFEKDTKVSAKASGTGIDFQADGKDGIRLEAPVTVSMKLKKKIPAAEIPYYYVVYKKGGKEYLIEPDPKELRKGYAVFQTDHFSEYDLVKASVKRVIKNKAYYAAAYKFSADTIDGFAAKAFEKSFDAIDKILDRIVDKLSDGRMDRSDTFLKKRMKNSLFRNAEFIGVLRGLATGDAKVTVKSAIDLCVKKVCEGLEKEKAYKAARAAGMALPEMYKQWKNGNKLAAIKEVSDAVSGEIDEVSAMQGAYNFALLARGTYNEYNIQMAVQGLLGTKEGEDAGYHGGYDITRDDEWEDFKKYDMKGAYRLFKEAQMEGWREMKRAGGDLTKEEKAVHGVLDERLVKYSKQVFYSDPEMAAERKAQEALIDNDLRQYLLERLANETKIREEAARIEEQIAAYINAGLFGFDEELNYAEEEYSTRISELMELKEMVEAKFEGSSPGKLEGYDSKNVYSVDCRRYAEFIKIYLDANEKAGDNTGASGIRALAEELAKRYGLGIEITPQKFIMDIGETGSFTVMVDETYDIISQCRISTFDKKAASVNKKGEIKALADGEGDITVKYGKKEHKLHVLVGEGNLHINPKGYKELEIGKTQNLALKKEDGTNVKGMPEWKSSDTKVLTVDTAGKVSAKKAGKATVTATYNKREYKKEFTVKQRVELTYTNLKLTVGESKKLTLLGAESAKVSWGFKGGAGIVALTQKGKVTAKGAGKVTVIAEYKGKKYTCVVTVKKKVKKEKADVVGYYRGTMKINVYIFSTTPSKTEEKNGVIRVESAGSGKYNIYAWAENKSGYFEGYGEKAGVSGSSGSISLSDEFNSFHCNGKTATWTHYRYAVDSNGNETKLVDWSITGTKT